MGRVCSTNGEEEDKKNAYRILAGKPKRKEPVRITKT
jgi:hypothetical protein